MQLSWESHHGGYTKKWTKTDPKNEGYTLVLLFGRTTLKLLFGITKSLRVTTSGHEARGNLHANSSTRPIGVINLYVMHHRVSSL